MKTVVHIGMAKAGSTALQSCLQGSQAHLAARGLLYPRNPPGCAFNNHRLLAAQFLPFEALPRHMKGRTGYTAETIDGAVEAFIDHAARQIEALRPAGLILSSETLFRKLPEARRDAVRGVYGRFGGDARFVAYLRRPSQHYLAGLLQRITASTVVRSPRPARYREVLESYAECFGAGAVTARLYDRDHMEGGDIVADFFKHSFPEFEVDLARLDRSGRRNETLSAESMDVVAGYRAAFHAERNDVHTRDTTRLRATLAESERRHGAAKPRLHPRIAEMVDYASPDCLWVRDRFGVIFPGLDYDRLAGAPPPTLEPIRDLGRLIVIDRDMRMQLLEDVAQSPWAEADPARATWVRHALQGGRT